MNLERQRSHPLFADGATQTLSGVLERTRHERAYYWAADLVRGQVVLEVGCNTGYGTRILAQEAAKVFAIDVNPAAIEYARNQHQLTNVEYLHTDGNSFPLLNPRPRYAVFFQLFEHLSNAEEFLIGVNSAIAKNGQILLTTPNGEMRLRKNQKPWNSFHVKEYRLDELREILDQVFGSCQVFGLFGTPVVHEMERRRVKQTLMKLHVIEPLKRLLHWYSVWPRVEHRVQRHLGITLQKAAEAWAFSPDCYYLSTENLVDALDFYAVAPKSSES